MSSTLWQKNLIPSHRMRREILVFLSGFYRPFCPISKLPLEILDLIITAYKDIIESHLSFPSERSRPHGFECLNQYFFKSLFEFPKPLQRRFKKVSININMMPIVMGEDSSLPENVRRYSQLIHSCLHHVPEEEGKVGYLTIQEDWVLPGQCQRRPGLHIESPAGEKRLGAGYLENIENLDGRWFRWGAGTLDPDLKPIGGIFMGSTVSDSCQIYNAKIVNPEKIVGKLGCVESLRVSLDALCRSDRLERKVLKAREIVWFTDLTPHESLPVREKVFRQYFRLVTSDVSAWYSQHSTANPCGTVVPTETVTIINKNKFD